jgi:hypothetical protein
VCQSPWFEDLNNYGLDGEDVEFNASDGVTLLRWLIKSRTEIGEERREWTR